MIDKLLSLIAPHHCLTCSKPGSLLCDGCKYNITMEPFQSCLLCRRLIAEGGICRSCRPPYDKAWCVGWREGALEGLIDSFKFKRAKAAHRILAGLLLDTIDQLPVNTVVVPIPTVASNIRQRGYDHALLLARGVASKRRLKLDRAIKRLTTTRQLSSNRKQRLQQAQAAFRVEKPLDPSRPYLVIDDVVTTGATIEAATKALRAAGAKTIWVAVIARQPLDR